MWISIISVIKSREIHSLDCIVCVICSITKEKLISIKVVKMISDQSILTKLSPYACHINHGLIHNTHIVWIYSYRQVELLIISVRTIGSHNEFEVCIVFHIWSFAEKSERRGVKSDPRGVLKRNVCVMSSFLLNKDINGL